jgi:hypothetical protein
MNGQHWWIFTECSAGTTRVDDKCVNAAQPVACICRPWAAIDFKVKKNDAVVCEGKGDCASRMNLVGNTCADPDGSGTPWCWLSEACTVARSGQLPWIQCWN